MRILMFSRNILEPDCFTRHIVQTATLAFSTPGACSFSGNTSGEIHALVYYNWSKWFDDATARKVPKLVLLQLFHFLWRRQEWCNAFLNYATELWWTYRKERNTFRKNDFEAETLSFWKIWRFYCAQKVCEISLVGKGVSWNVISIGMFVSLQPNW